MSTGSTAGAQVIVVDLAAAQEAQNRLDDGLYTDDDKPQLMALAAQYEGYLQQEWDRATAEWDRVDRARWLATQCGGCEPGGTGEACDEHWLAEASELDLAALDAADPPPTDPERSAEAERLREIAIDCAEDAAAKRREDI